MNSWVECGLLNNNNNWTNIESYLTLIRLRKKVDHNVGLIDFKIIINLFKGMHEKDSYLTWSWVYPWKLVTN